MNYICDICIIFPWLIHLILLKFVCILTTWLSLILANSESRDINLQLS